MKFLKFGILFHLSIMLYGQSEFLEPQFIVAQDKNWNMGAEGKEMKINFSISDTSHIYTYQIVSGKQLGMELSQEGQFKWTPDYSFVNRLEKKKLFQINIVAEDENNERISKTFDLIISHTNRPPVIGELKPFYVRYNSENEYKIDKNLVYDPDNDPIILIPELEFLPQTMVFTTEGEITWKPSFSQFNKIKKEDVYISFYAEDQPEGEKTRARIKLTATQLDLPPVITVIPNTSKYTIRENQSVNILFYLTDPNGDETIKSFDFLNKGLPIEKSNLKKISDIQYEFIWNPNYDFVAETDDSLHFDLEFFVLDETQKKEVKTISFTVKNSINQDEEDKKNYQLYEGSLERGWELLEQLKEKEEELKESYKKAKKGKKNRSVVNASLGASTGLSSVIFKEKADLQRGISTIGGTTVLTIGTLEATEVIGKSMKEIIDRLNYVIEKKNEIQTKGDIFARDYSSVTSRRSPSFVKKVDEFMSAMNLKGLVALELDASWEPKTKSSIKGIKKTFHDFEPAK